MRTGLLAYAALCALIDWERSLIIMPAIAIMIGLITADKIKKGN